MVLAKRAHRTDHVRLVPVSVSSNITGDFRSRGVLLIAPFYHKKHSYSSIPRISACPNKTAYRIIQT